MTEPRIEQVGRGLWAVTNYDEMWADARARSEKERAGRPQGEESLPSVLFESSELKASEEEAPTGDPT